MDAYKFIFVISVMSAENSM